jgi:predicted RNA-binding protein with RPS1 domain
VLKVGQEVEAKIIEVNVEAKKINLSIKEVNPIDPEGYVPEPPKEAEKKPVSEPVPAKEVIPSEHTEVLTNTIADALKAPVEAAEELEPEGKAEAPAEDKSAESENAPVDVAAETSEDVPAETTEEAPAEEQLEAKAEEPVEAADEASKDAE